MRRNSTLKVLLEETISRLEEEHISERRIESELFLAHLYGCSRPELYLRLSEKVNAEKIFLCQKFIQKRKKGIPIPFILGETEFMGLKFFLKPGVFIPRQETEILVEETIKIVQNLKKVKNENHQEPSTLNFQPLTILDLGTGSGNIAVSLAKYLPEARIIATDISKRALEFAKKNARLHNVDKQIIFLAGDLFQSLTTSRFSLTTYDLVVSNPPYIAENDLVTLEKELFYEPANALFAQNNGLEYYEKIIPQAKRFLRPAGYLLLEIGYGQKEEVEKIFFSSGYREVKVVKDYSDIERVIIGGDYTT